MEVHYVTGNILNLKNVTPDMTPSNLTNIQVPNPGHVRSNILS